MARKARYKESFPDILEEGIQHHNRVITQEGIQRQTLKYIRDDYDENHNKYSQFDRDRLTLIVWSNNK